MTTDNYLFGEKMRELEDMPGFLFRVLENKSNTLFQKKIAGTNLTTRQFGVLWVLSNHGPMHQSELSERISSDKSTIGDMVSRLEQRQMISRTPGDDRRSVVIDITEQGRDMVGSVSPLVLEAQRDILAALPAEYRLIFLKCLRLLAKSTFDAT